MISGAAKFTVNRQITLASRPVGFPKISDFQLVYSRMPEPAAGEVLLRAVYFSLDSCSRRRMNEATAETPRMAIGEVMAGCGVARVLASEDPRFRAGDTVEGFFGWQEYAVCRGSEMRKIDRGPAPMSTALGVLGLPGLTAYFGLLDIADPQQGETVVISGAAGAIGMLAGQIAKTRGCRVVGVAGSDPKIAWLLDELGFDAAVNYHQNGADLRDQLAASCPDGIDVYFDSVGGAISEAAYERINQGARISQCGLLSQLNLEAPGPGARWMQSLLAKQVKLQGFLISTYSDRFPEGLAQLAAWLAQGKLKYWEVVAQGIEAAPQAFIGMLHGDHRGKQMIQLAAA